MRRFGLFIVFLCVCGSSYALSDDSDYADSLKLEREKNFDLVNENIRVRCENEFLKLALSDLQKRGFSEQVCLILLQLIGMYFVIKHV